MRTPFFTLLAVIALSGCAGAGQATPERENLTVVIVNDFDSRVTAYAVWPSGSPRRLGEVSSNRTRTFETPRSGSEIAIGLRLISAPPVGTTVGPTALQGGGPLRINPDVVRSESMLIVPGQGIEWRLTAAGSLLFRRIVL